MAAKLPRLALASLSAGLLLAAAPWPATAAGPPAGQRCPPGAHVIGFDDDANIICSHACGNGVVEGTEACDDGNRVDGDGCSARCAQEGGAGVAPAAAASAAAPAAAPAPAAAAAAPSVPSAAASAPEPAPPPAAPSAAPSAPAVAAAAPELTVTDVDPYSVVYGKREHAVTVTGTGFTPATVVVFQGRNYTPTVNVAGTELRVTLATGALAIGRYALKVSNGPGQEVTLKRAIAVY